MARAVRLAVVAGSLAVAVATGPITGTVLALRCRRTVARAVAAVRPSPLAIAAAIPRAVAMAVALALAAVAVGTLVATLALAGRFATTPVLMARAAILAVASARAPDVDHGHVGRRDGIHGGTARLRDGAVRCGATGGGWRRYGTGDRGRGGRLSLSSTVDDSANATIRCGSLRRLGELRRCRGLRRRSGRLAKISVGELRRCRRGNGNSRCECGVGGTRGNRCLDSD